MDNYNFDSEVIESLNLLRPPVKRATGNANRDFTVYCSNNTNIQVLKEFGHKFKSKCGTKNYFQQRTHEDSSTSLILKKTSETQIFKQCSVVSYTGLHCQEQSNFSQSKTPIARDKPLIKVTVIPKSEQNAAPKLFGKQRIVTKTIHATSSNHENSIQTKNVYLVVAGRKKDKIYEIKTTGSAKFEKETIKDTLEHVCHFKDFIKSLNMERKKKNKKKVANRNETQVNICETTAHNIEHACKCSPAGSEVSVHEVRPGRSRVRIFGRIGLTKDDKYVLKCQATVDDKPVLTSALKKQPSDSSLAVCSRNAETSTYQRNIGLVSGKEECEKNTRDKSGRFRRTRNDRVRETTSPEEEPMLWRNTGSLCVRENSDRDIKLEKYWKTNDAVSEEESDDGIQEEPVRNLRDVLMQTEVRGNVVNDLLIEIQNKHKISNQSQATQVNFNKSDETVNKIKAYHNEPVKICNCSNQDSPLIETIDNSQFCPATLKPCQSPMVIISVFPKQNNNKADVVQTIQCAHLDNKLAMRKYPDNKAEIMADMHVNKTTDKDHELRSPSPTGRKMKFKVNKILETRHTKSITRNDIPKLGKKHYKKGTMSPKQPTMKQEFLSTKPADTNDKKHKTSPIRSPRAKSPPPTKREPQNKNLSRQSLKTKAKQTKKVDVGINTEHQKTKKALVDSYTSKITEHLSGNKEGPAKTLSTVSVNIDSEHECYDVTFREDKLNTDVIVRRTMKEASIQKEMNEDVYSCYPNTKTKHKKSSKTKKIFVENHKDDLEKDTPKLAVRDSLEIGHRREGKVIKVTQTHRSPIMPAANNNDMEFLAPIKHFTGDNCTICDPLERDREIRELLGVEERRNNGYFNDSKDRVVAFENHLSRRCFYNKQCEQLFVTGFALSQPLTPCNCNNDNDCNDANCEDSDFKLHHDDDSDDDEEVLPTNNTDNKSNKTSKRSEQKNKSKANEDDEHKEKSRHRTISNKSYKNEQKEKSENNIKNDCCKCKDASTQLKGVNRDEYSEMNRDSCPCLDDTNKCDIPCCDKFGTQRKITESAQNKELSDQQEPIKTDADRKMTNASKQGDLFNNNSNVTSLSQQLTLNRNIQIFLQVEQFAKQKPIVLSKKQYNKIKKTIQRTILAKEKSKRCVCNRSIVSVSPKNVELDHTHSHREAKIVQSIKGSKKSRKSSKMAEPIETVVLFSNETRGSVKAKKPPKVIVQRAASSLEVRNTGISYWKHVTFSSTNMGSIGSSSIANRNQPSLETIVIGHNKSRTPNLGTSALSLLSEARISESQSLKLSPDTKTKKPFLKRLMSCLVLRSRVSEKIPMPVSPQSANSSVDSYHVSTSFAGIEMTSSIYDTSVSFYSDHSIHPLSSKFKRSFLSSVRDFLTSRKS